jgi:hypothetical protein
MERLGIVLLAELDDLGLGDPVGFRTVLVADRDVVVEAHVGVVAMDRQKTDVLPATGVAEVAA